MSVSRPCINIIFSLLLLLSGGCKTTEEKKKSQQEKEQSKDATIIRLHLETSPVGNQKAATIPIYRANPMMVTVLQDAFLDPGFLLKAEVVEVDEHGGFAIKLIFDDAGKFRLDNVTAANKGRRIAIMAQWTEVRWLAAPRISRRISDGVFVFTPDATREESERIVNGLNNVIKKVRKKFVF